MKNLNKLIVSAFLTSLLMGSQAALAEHEEQELIPAPSSHMITPHEHKIGNNENGDDLAKNKTETAPNTDDHHEKESMDDTNQ